MSNGNALSCPGHHKTIRVSLMSKLMLIGAAGLSGKSLRNVSTEIYLEEFRQALSFCHYICVQFL